MPKGLTQKTYDQNPNLSGWFSFLIPSTEEVQINSKRLKIGNIIIPPNSIFHLKNGLLHNEEGPALFCSKPRKDFKKSIGFFINGEYAPDCHGLLLYYVRFEEIKSSII